ncbi:MAG TPA: DNA primase [Rhizomicrobium sp.]|jgi:DNA primase|nr:DNA primase [Rhizomicrobium sp.]
MRFGPHLLDEILRRTDLVALVGRRVKLVRKGRVMWGCCPFHNEKSASFKVENERRAYKCFGCGAGGDAFKWLIETEGLNFPEAVERLAGEAGVELPKWTPEEEAREEKKKSLYDVIEAACVFFEEQLRGAAGAQARDYLRGRGLNGEVAAKFRLGYAASGNGLLEHLKTKNITVDDMIAAGVVRPAQDGRAARDFFFDRLMFPITDPRGRVVAFGGRGLAPDAKPKYINTSETALFSKGQMLYNFATARGAAIKAQSIVVAEGYMDVIALCRGGFDYAVAPLGTALTDDQLHLLWRTAPEPIMAFDGDEAGLRAAHRAARLALPHLKAGFSLRFAFLPTGEDPDSFLRANGPAPMKKILDEALPLSQVLWRVETEGKDFSTPERRAGLEHALGEIAAAIGDSKIADYYRRDFDQKVFDAFKRRPNAAPRREWQPSGPRRTASRYGAGLPKPLPGTGEAVSPAVKASLLARSGRSGALRTKEVEIATILVSEPGLGLRHAELLADLPFSDPSLDSLRAVLLNLAASGSSLEKQGFETHLNRLGMDALVLRLQARTAGQETSSDPSDTEDIEARFLKACADLREMAERAPERARAFERFKADGTEESWNEAQRLLGRRD